MDIFTSCIDGLPLFLNYNGALLKGVHGAPLIVV